MSQSLSPSSASRVRITREALTELAFPASPRAALPRTDFAGRLPFMSASGAPPALRETLLQNLHSTAFPYPRHLRASGVLDEREYDIVHLENERFSLKLVPGLGGRILGLSDRSLGTDLLWQPTALRNAAVGLAGAWIVGGIEFNAFRYGHLAYGQSTLLTEEVQLASGWKGLRIGAVDEMFDASWSVLIALLPDQVAMRIRLENHGEKPAPGYWWTNIAVPAHNRTKLFFHHGPVLHHGVMRNELIPETWPVLHGRDWSEWTEHHECISAYFTAHGSDFIGYGDRGTGLGFAHRAPLDACRGRKLWSLGAQYSNAVWLSRMAEPGISSYVELQSGRLPTQIESDLLAPGQVLGWTESVTGLSPGRDIARDHQAAFTAFESAATQAMQPSARAVEDAENWRVVSARTLVREDARLAVSRRAVFFPAQIDRRTAGEVCAQGWVAGGRWRRILADLAAREPLPPAAELALAAAEFDAGELETAAQRLGDLTASPDSMVRGWANLLLAVLHHKLRGKPEAAWPHARAAGAALAEDPDALNTIHEILFAAGRTLEAAELWNHAPAAHRESDAGRYARAQLAFAAGEYRQACDLLAAPMLSIGENAFAAWMLWKEAHLAEALALWRTSELGGAMRRLTLAAEAATQFSLGRDESEECRDLLYYRWLLARERGQELAADTFAGWLRAARAFPSTVDAAYLARFARETEHTSAGQRQKEIVRWQDGAHDIDLWNIHPLHQAVMHSLNGSARAGWEKLRSHWLYRPRAEFELGRATARATAGA